DPPRARRLTRFKSMEWNTMANEQPYRAIPISEHVYWVGGIDWSIRDFHGYLTSRGTTYNAFLVVNGDVDKGGKAILVDTVKRPFYDELVSRISSVIDPQRIDTIISHHAEMDHSGCLPEICDLVKPSRVLTSKAGVLALREHFPLEDVPLEAVKGGSTVDLDGMRFLFQETRMLHWPESMVSFLENDGVLFAQDAFGLHLASQLRWADELSWSVVEEETAKYFANILLPFAAPVGKILDKLSDVILSSKVIATDHGPLWRKDIDKLFGLYQKWAAREPSKKIAVAYASMWQSTEKMARAIAEGAADAGVETKLLGLKTSHRSDVAAEVLDAAALLIGTPTLNGQLYPTVADLLSYLRGLKPKGLLGASFGSYGWNTTAVKQAQEGLEAFDVEIVREPLAVKFVPTTEDLLACRAYGAEIAQAVLERVGAK
ncbi:MAG: FprA family A-type flavoprotein, partial [Deltaproteobacteria bacterium]|nr:FprA family A-type flavoprotein [Deltaproteobacteria bacterium]